jgi:hypothetical protein
MMVLCVTKPSSQKGVDFICQFFGFRQELPPNFNFILKVNIRGFYYSAFTHESGRYPYPEEKAKSKLHMILKMQGQQWLGFLGIGQNKTGPSIMDSPVKKERRLCM